MYSLDIMLAYAVTMSSKFCPILPILKPSEWLEMTYLVESHWFTIHSIHD